LSGWFVTGWFVVLFIVITIWFNIAWSRMQRRVARQRPSLDRQAYGEEFARSGVSSKVADAIHDSLAVLCVKGVSPHPDDGLTGFYFDDPEDMEDLVEEMFEKLGLPMPTRYAPEITPHLNSVRELGVYLQSKLDC
jgi:hypothetical protein